MAALHPVGARGAPHLHRGRAAPQRDPQHFNSAPFLSLQMSRSSWPSTARRSKQTARPRSGRRMHCPGSSRTGSRRQVGLPGVANSRQRPHGGGSGDGAGPGLCPNAELLASGTSGPTPPACHAGPGLLVGQLLTPGVTLSVLGDCVARGCVQRPNCEDRARHRWAERPGRCVFHSGSTLSSSRACPAHGAGAAVLSPGPGSRGPWHTQCWGSRLGCAGTERPLLSAVRCGAARLPAHQQHLWSRSSAGLCPACA